MKRHLLEILIIITGLCILATVGGLEQDMFTIAGAICRLLIFGGLMYAECKISEKILKENADVVFIEEDYYECCDSLDSVLTTKPLRLSITSITSSKTPGIAVYS